jgi:hypothetical protein
MGYFWYRYIFLPHQESETSSVDEALSIWRVEEEDSLISRLENNEEKPTAKHPGDKVTLASLNKKVDAKAITKASTENIDSIPIFFR